MRDIPPELREGFGEVEAAANNKIPELIEESDIINNYCIIICFLN